MTMDKECLKKIEKIVYEYFQCRLDIESINRKINLLESQINEIDKDIRTTNVKIDYYQKGITMNERVQTSTNSISYVEAEFDKAIGALERELCNKTKEILEVREKLREKESFLESIEGNINMLEEEDRRFIELKYKYKKTIPSIAMELNIAQATAYRKREKLIMNIAQYINPIWM